MGLGERAQRLLRAYIGREFERIEQIGRPSAEKELEVYLNDPAVRAQARVAEHQETKRALTEFEEALAILGVEKRSSLSELKQAYKRLYERSLPTHFPDGSDEQKKATEIHERVQKAYDLLLPHFDPRLKRFQSLNI